jgi:hypothetical protein
MKTRQQKRNEIAELVCRELRYQLARPDSFQDFKQLMELLLKWMKVAKQNKWEKP